MKTKVYSLVYKEREKVSKIVESAAAIMREGGIVAFPSETCYCLAIDTTNPAAVEKLLALGVRVAPSLNVVVADMRMAKEHFSIAKDVEDVTYKFTPGPLTIVSKLLPSSKISKSLIEDGESIGFRISGSEIARMLSNELNAPITAAVVEDAPTIYSLNELKLKFDGKIEGIIEMGNLIAIIPSTIIDMRGVEPVLMREGPITFDEFQRELARAREVKTTT